MTLSTKILASLLLCAAVSAHATIISASGNTFDDRGSSTVDLATGLEWRDVNLTEGRSACSVEKDTGGPIPAGCTQFDNLDVIPDTDGWHYATRAEVVQLMTDWMGVAIDPNGQTVVNAALAGLFLDVFAGGETNFRPDFLGDEANIEQAAGIFLQGGFLTIGIHNGSINGSCCSQGSLLIRNATASAVPEPAPVTLLGAGLAGLVAVRRRRH